MRHLIYGYTSVMVSDPVADAVLEYAAALSQSRLSDVVTVPTTDYSGLSSSVRILLSSGIALMSEPAPDDVLETEDRAFVAELRTRIVAVLAGGVVPRSRPAM